MMSWEIVKSLKCLVNLVPKRWNRALELFLRAAHRSRVWIVAAWKPSWPMYISKYLYILWWTFASTMTSSSDKLSPKFTSSSFYVSFPFYWPAPNVWFFIVQLVEHCSYNAEAMSILIPLSPQNNFRLIGNSLNCNYHSDDYVFI